MELQGRLRNAVVFLVFLFGLGTLGYKRLGGPQTGYFDGFYMTLISVTTIGYGEFVRGPSNSVELPDEMLPIRIFTVVMVICGVGTLAYVVTTLTALVVEGELTTILRRRKMEHAIAKLQNHFIVCGLGETGLHVVEELDKNMHWTVVVDPHEERLKKLQGFKYVLQVAGDATDEEVLLSAGLEKASGIVLALPNDKDNLFLTVTARQLNPNIRIVAKEVDIKLKTRLTKAGADSVVAPNYIGGLRMASEMIRPTAVSFLDAMLRSQAGTMRIDEIEIGRGSEFEGKSLAEMRIRERFDLLVLGAKPSATTDIVFNPQPTERFPGGTHLVVMGEMKDIHEARKTMTAGA